MDRIDRHLAPDLDPATARRSERLPIWHRPLRALASTLFDRGAGVPAERIDWAVLDVADFLDHAGPRTSFFLTVTAFLVELLPIVVVKRPARMSSMSSKDRLAYLEALERSSLAIFLILPKTLLALVYYEHPDALRETGYDGTCATGQIPHDVGLVRLRPRVEAARSRGEIAP